MVDQTANVELLKFMKVFGKIRTISEILIFFFFDFRTLSLTRNKVELVHSGGDQVDSTS